MNAHSFPNRCELSHPALSCSSLGSTLSVSLWCPGHPITIDLERDPNAVRPSDKVVAAGQEAAVYSEEEEVEAGDADVDRIAGHTRVGPDSRLMMSVWGDTDPTVLLIDWIRVLAGWDGSSSAERVDMDCNRPDLVAERRIVRCSVAHLDRVVVSRMREYSGEAEDSCFVRACCMHFDFVDIGHR